jgi:aminopeptidase
VERLRPRDPRASPPQRNARHRAQRHGDLAGQHLRRLRPAQRASQPHADDRCRQPPSHASRPHGQHHPRDHDPGNARRLPRHRPTLSQAVLDKVRAATYVRATTPAGTDIHAQLNPDYRWFKTSGIISTEKWGNLPGGECFTAPGEVNGVFVVDGVVGDYLCARYGILRAQPLTINIEGNRITRVISENKALERDFWAYTHTDENSDRVGEFAIGTNIGVERVIGNILQDEKFPGIHIAFGDPYGAHTGAPWKSSTHIDVVGLEFSIWLGDADGEEQIMRDGQFLLDA